MQRKKLGVWLVPSLLLILAIAFVVAGCGGDDETTTTTAAPATETTAGDGGGVDGAALFSANCSSCHGAGGEGGVGPDIRGEDNVERVKEQVTNGGGAMPAFGDTLSAEEIAAVAEYVTTLQ